MADFYEEIIMVLYNDEWNQREVLKQFIIC